jgi:hypothetical protein
MRGKGTQVVRPDPVLPPGFPSLAPRCGARPGMTLALHDVRPALRAWWIPYVLIDEPKRAARYQIMFGRTYSFLPERRGIRPNALHVALHVVVAAVLLVLFLT